MELATRIDFDTCFTIGVTGLFAVMFCDSLGGTFETFACGWLWAMVMAVLLRKAYEHV